MPFKPTLMKMMAKAIMKMPAMQEEPPDWNRGQQLMNQRAKEKKEIARCVQRGANMSGK